MIRKEFGPDAVIIDSKAIRRKGVGGLFQKKMVEVVAALEPTQKKTFGSPRKKEVSETKTLKAKPDMGSDETIRQLNDQITALQDTVQDFSNKIRIVDKETTLTFSPEVLGLYNDLVKRDVYEELAKQIAAQIQEAVRRKPMEISTAVHQLVTDRLGEAVPLKLKKYKQNVLLFAGPTGTGKTTTLAKLAGRFKLEQNLEVGLINMDTYRIGAIEHIRIYSEIMDIPLMTAYSVEELKKALKALENKDVILIDTAGKNPADEEYMNELKTIIQAGSVDEVFLVLSVVTGFKVCKKIIENFTAMDDYKLIITKLDEVEAWGNVLNIADCSQKPISFVANGQTVPDDIHPIDLKELADSITADKGALL